MREESPDFSVAESGECQNRFVLMKVKLSLRSKSEVETEDRKVGRGSRGRGEAEGVSLKNSSPATSAPPAPSAQLNERPTRFDHSRCNRRFT